MNRRHCSFPAWLDNHTGNALCLHSSHRLWSSLCVSSDTKSLLESLYSNISHEQGVAVISYFLDLQEGTDQMHDLFIIDLLDFILQHNYFTFETRLRQCYGGELCPINCQPFPWLVGKGTHILITNITAENYSLVSLYWRYPLEGRVPTINFLSEW